MFVIANKKLKWIINIRISEPLIGDNRIALIVNIESCMRDVCMPISSLTYWL